jgi:hypothetical protein
MLLYTDEKTPYAYEILGMTRKGPKKEPCDRTPEKSEDSGGISAKSLAPEFNPKSIVAFALLPSSDDLADLLVKLGADETWAKNSSPALVETLLRLNLDDVAPSGPEKAPILYEDRPKGMTPPQFLKIYYKDHLDTLTRKHLRSLDEKAAIALYRWEQRHPNDPDLVGLDIPNQKDALDRQRPKIANLDEFFREAMRQRSQENRLSKG